MTAGKLIADMFTQFCRDVTEIRESQITWCCILNLNSAVRGEELPAAALLVILDAELLAYALFTECARHVKLLRPLVGSIVVLCIMVPVPRLPLIHIAVRAARDGLGQAVRSRRPLLGCAKNDDGD